jgi:integrase
LEQRGLWSVSVNVRITAVRKLTVEAADNGLLAPELASGTGLPNIAPHDLRGTTAKLCRAAGGELERSQLLLGHSSVQTTEPYLGTKQDLAHAPNDAIKLKLAVRGNEHHSHQGEHIPLDRNFL